MNGQNYNAWSTLDLRELTLPNRVWLSPMCQYSATSDGLPNDWHLAHYGARAAGGFGMVMVECTGIAPDMRTTPADLGIWSAEQVAGHGRLVTAIRSIGSIPALQLGAAGRRVRTALRGTTPAPDPASTWTTVAGRPSRPLPSGSEPWRHLVR